MHFKVPTVTARDLRSGDLAVQPGPTAALFSVPQLHLPRSQRKPGFYQSSRVCFLLKEYFDFIWMELWQEIWILQYFTYRVPSAEVFYLSFVRMIQSRWDFSLSHYRYHI